MSRKSGFTILDHPADIGIQAQGPNLSDVFVQSALGMMSIILDLSTVEVRESRQVELSGSDAEQLLVKWLTEILYTFDGEGFVGKEFRVVDLSEGYLKASISGELLDSRRHSTRLDVKAVTYHQLSVQSDREGVVAKVYLDI